MRAEFIGLLGLSFGASYLLHRRVLGRLKSRHFAVWASLGSLSPLDALTKAAIPGLFQSSGALSYHGRLHNKEYRNLSDSELAAWAERLRLMSLVLVPLGLTLLVAMFVYGRS